MEVGKEGREVGKYLIYFSSLNFWVKIFKRLSSFGSSQLPRVFLCASMR
jgi:hypothetical protein